MLSFKIFSNEIEDRLLVPFYEVLKITKQYPLTIADIKEEITNGMDLRAYEDEGTPYLRGVDIKRCQVNILTPKLVNFKLEDIDEKIKLKEGDILITRKGTVGVTSVVSSDCKDVIIGTEIIKLRLKKDAVVSPEYVYTLLNSKIGIMQIYSKMTGTVSRGINQASLITIKIPTLPDKQQKKIEGWVKEAKQKHLQALTLIEQAKALLLSVFDAYEPRDDKYFKVYSDNIDNDYFTPKFYYPLYNRTIEFLRKNFKIIKLGDEGISTIKKGNEVGHENYRTYLERLETDLPFVRTSDLPNYEVDDYPDYYVDLSIYEELKQDIQPNDVLFSNDGKIGFSCLLLDVDKVVLQSHIRRIRVLNGLSPEYVMVFLNTKYGQYQIKKRTVVQATIPTIGDGLKQIEIPIIPDKTEKKIAQLVKQASKLKAEKKLLIRKAKQSIESILLDKISN